MAVQTVDIVVHVAGPVEESKAGARRVRVQRCLRCDCLMRDERERTPFWLLGDTVGYDETNRAYLLDRRKLHDGEVLCVLPR